MWWRYCPSPEGKVNERHSIRLALQKFGEVVETGRVSDGKISG